MDIMINIVYKAVLENDLKSLKQLLITHNISLKNVTNETHNERLVHLAIEKNYQDIVFFLVNNGANLNSCKTIDMSPLILAISLGNVTMTELLIDLGASIDEGKLSNTAPVVCPLHFAVSGLHLDIVLLLLSKGANVNGRAVFNNDTALHVLCYFDYVYFSDEDRRQKIKTQVKIAKALLENGAVIDSRNRLHMTPVDCSLSKNKTELCELLFLEGAPVKKAKNDGTYLEYLGFVITLPCPQLTRLCLERGCDFSRKEEMHGSSTPYHGALQFGNPDVVKVFLKFGCPFDLPYIANPTDRVFNICLPNEVNVTVLTIQKAFIEGIKNNNIEYVKTALAHGAEPKGCSTDIPSTLHHVTANGNHELVELLLMKGVPANRINTTGETPLFIAVKNKNFEVSEILLKYGACINFGHSSKNNTKEIIGNCAKLQKFFKVINTCFTLVKQGNKKCLEIIKNYNFSDDNKMLSALMNCVNRKGLSLMTTALKMGHTKIAEDLMKLRIEKL